MRQVDPLSWSDLGVSELVPTGTVTLLLADVEGSTRLWQTQPEAMTAAIAGLDRTLAELVSAHHGVRPIEQGEGDSFVIAFSRASDAVACALALQLAPLAPIKMRMGLHTGEVQLRDEGNYVGPTINRCGRLRGLAHGGQTIMSATTSDLVIDHLPADAWLTDLGSHTVRDLPRPEHIMQLCHPDLPIEFPSLRTSDIGAAQHLPAQLTSFVGREGQQAEVRGLLGADRLVTLTGAGGVGKTRLALQVAGGVAAEFGGGVWFVDLAPITDPALAALAAARALGLPDQLGRSATDTVVRFIGDGHVLVVLDNCEHLIDAVAALTTALLGGCPGLTILATSREPIGVPGEVSWRVPSLSLAGEAVELFADRARHARPDFTVTDDDLTVLEICRRLDGMPLALELAAARVRALTVSEILDGLRDRFRLLTGGARTSVRRQQTLQASVDWSHALLTDLERLVFRRLGVFVGGFDLDAAEAVVGDASLRRYQVLDLLALLVDKSLVVAENPSGRTRYRLMETVRQYALEKLGESGEAAEVRNRHRDHYGATAMLLEEPLTEGLRHRVERTAAEIDNLRAAFVWSCETADADAALRLASALQPVWLCGRIMEGLSWFYSVLNDPSAQLAHVGPAVHVRALVDTAYLTSVLGLPDTLERAQQWLGIAREAGEPRLLLRALLTCGSTAAFNPDVARPYLAEAGELARSAGDSRSLSQVLWWQSYVAVLAGAPQVSRQAAEEGYRLADEIGDRFVSRMCRSRLGTALMLQGELAAAATQFRELIIESETAHDPFAQVGHLAHFANTLTFAGDPDGARAAARKAVDLAAEFGGFMEGAAYAPLARAELAAGDAEAAAEAAEIARQRWAAYPLAAAHGNPIADAALACGDVVTAKCHADEAVSRSTGVYAAMALLTRARVEIAQGNVEHAERDAHKAMAVAAALDNHVTTADTLECLASVARDSDSHREAARLFGAADAVRRRIGVVRFKVYDAWYDAAVAAVREALGNSDFDAAWAEGAALSTQEAIAYAQRGRGERKRPASGWASLTPAEHDVVRLVSEGLGNKEIGARLFVSPRTVQAHLTHVYTKLGLSSRVQLAQEATRHG